MKIKRLIPILFGLILLALGVPIERATASSFSGTEKSPPSQSRASSTTKIGVLECDTYIDKYIRCISQNVPADQRSPLFRELEQSIKQWRPMTETPRGKADAINACRTARQAARQAMTVYGCEWE